MPHPNDPKLRSFIAVDPSSDFPIQNLPYGVFSAKDGLAPRVGVAIGNYVLDLWQLAQDCRIDVVEPAVFAAPTLNPFMALGPKVWTTTRARAPRPIRSPTRMILSSMAATELSSTIKVAIPIARSARISRISEAVVGPMTSVGRSAAIASIFGVMKEPTFGRVRTDGG